MQDVLERILCRPIRDAPFGHLHAGQADGLGAGESGLDDVDGIECRQQAGDFLDGVDYRFPAVWSPCQGVRLCLGVRIPTTSTLPSAVAASQAVTDRG